MKLRKWQKECIDQAIYQFSEGSRHFMCLATPGAGKTTMASVLTKKLFDSRLIDLVICLSPSAIVSHDFRIELERQCQKRLDGSLGSNGCSLTYQGMLCVDDKFWSLLDEYRIFVIFDEIHHCAGNEFSQTNAWGEKIIHQIQGKAAYTLALTGTPWRSDNTPIVLSNYCDNNRVQCNYTYGLSQAIADGVCRTPKITMIDNERITWQQGEKCEEYSSFEDILRQEKCSYQNLIENEELIIFILKEANNKLNLIRETTPNAGGLIVAASVSHAKKLHKILISNFYEQADLATYQEDDAAGIIRQYKYGSKKWIISVGMISEGTNIPRLQICCYLTRVKTELYFRQVLGRILRTTGRCNEKGYLYIPAEPSLMKYVYRIASNIPDHSVVLMNSIVESIDVNSSSTHFDGSLTEGVYDTSDKADGPMISLLAPNSLDEPTLSGAYENIIGVFGHFKKDVFALTHKS